MERITFPCIFEIGSAAAPEYDIALKEVELVVDKSITPVPVSEL
jgi:hypothetical protein